MKQVFYPGDRAVLVYQAGIANVFRFPKQGTGTNERILQGAFEACEWFMRGVLACGVPHSVAWCNMAGDILYQPWRYDNFENAPFSDRFAKDILALERQVITRTGTVSDGFGNEWETPCPDCGEAVQVVRPGKTQCGCS